MRKYEDSRLARSLYARGPFAKKQTLTTIPVITELIANESDCIAIFVADGNRVYIYGGRQSIHLDCDGGT